ncbi:hypothetical protein LRS13_22035 [Svornostia abyssi]|uniref:Uncharacterized protein n=1 Tax=Svornostia abyssi TaxID=2898438 RepID=A0ABY5PFT2_9ACTN|nr:hypothetical protein LRS13_22035 [Parviterribacteraceae bacterium J379]
MVDWLTVGGLILDISGAAFLASGVAFPSAGKIAHEAQDSGSEPMTAIRVGADQADTRIGAGFLIAGFSAQALGASFETTLCWPFAAACVALGMLALAVRPGVVRRRRRAIFRARLRERRTHGPGAAALHVDAWRTVLYVLGEIPDKAHHDVDREVGEWLGLPEDEIAALLRDREEHNRIVRGL